MTRARFPWVKAYVTLVVLAGCGDREDAPSATATEHSSKREAAHANADDGARAPARIALEIDGAKQGELRVAAGPVVLGKLLPPGAKPVAAWKRIHASTDDGRYVLVTYPSKDYPGHVPMLYMRDGGEPVFAMVRPGQDGTLPSSSREMRKFAASVVLPRVSRMELWIDADPPRPTPPEGRVVFRFRNRSVGVNFADLEMSLDGETFFAGKGRTKVGGEQRTEPAREQQGKSDDGVEKAGGKPEGASLGWSLVDLLRQQVLRDETLVGIRLVPAEGDPIVVDPEWWTTKDRFLSIRPNRKGKVVVHGYILGERAWQKLSVRDVQVVEGLAEGGDRRIERDPSRHRDKAGARPRSGPGTGRGAGDGTARRRP